MSDFISVFDVVFGVRKCREDGAPRRPLPGWEIEPVGIDMVASTIESAGVHCFDDYSRFCKANDDQEKAILDALACYGKFRDLKHPSEVQEYVAGISEPENVPEWHSFGWERDKLPDFKYCLSIWEKSNNGSDEVDPEFQPRSNSRKWDLLIVGFRACVSTFPEVKGLEGEEKLKKYEAILCEVLDENIRSDYTQKIITQINKFGVTIDAKSLKKALREVPDRLRTSQ